jgi:HEAT repeat protein
MVPLLLQSLEKAEREGRANMAIWLLIGMKEQRAIAPLTALLQSKNRWLRSEAISGLGILGDKAIIPALEPLTHDPDPDIVLKAHGALLRLGRLESLEPLVTAAGDQNGMTSDAAMQMLAVSEHPHALVVLAGMLLDPQSPNRPQAAYWLMGRIAPAFLEALLAMANGTDPVERKLAALALAGNADPRTLAIQQRILRDGKTALPDNLAEYILPGLLQRVAIALAKQGDSDGMAYLVSVVGRYEQSYPSSQRTAARVLAEITGQDFGLDAAKWEAWWKEHRTAWPAD